MSKNPKIEVAQVAVVKNSRTEVVDDDWGDVVSTVELDAQIPTDALLGLDHFSHVEIVFWFHLVSEDRIEFEARHPRNNPQWPKVGIFAQRGKNRPNRLGVTIAEVVAIEGRNLIVRGLDAIDGTPVIDIKPVMKEFLPRKAATQPVWSEELMRSYWVAAPGRESEQ